MQKGKDTAKHKLEYALLTLLIQFFRLRPECSRGNVIAFFLRRLSPRHARLVAANLLRAFPDLSPAEREGLRCRVYRHFACVAGDLLRVAGNGDINTLLARSEVRHLEVVERVLAEGKGVILFSAHFGNWEWLPLALSRLLGRPLVSVARPMDNPGIEKKVLKLREMMGSRIVRKQGALRRIIAALDDNEPVYLLIDQNTVRREALFVDFFNHSAATIPAAAQLHLRRGVPLLPVFLHMEDRKAVVEIGAAVSFSPGTDREADTLRLTQQLTAIIEEQIRRYPEQWFWFHDRWKTRPQGVVHET